MSHTTFLIANKSDDEMIIIHEPECFTYSLPVGEEIVIEMNSGVKSIVMNQWIDNGKINIAILDCESKYKVLNNNIDVFAKYLDD